MTNEDKTRIIKNWCVLFEAMMVHDNKIIIVMDVSGFTYPCELYETIDDALEESYVRAHAHTWSVCAHIENQKEFKRIALL